MRKPSGCAMNWPNSPSLPAMSEPTAAVESAKATAPVGPGTRTTPSPSPTATTPVGDSAARLTWLHRELDRQLAAYRRRRRRDKRKSFGLQMATVTLSATITLLLGVRAPGTPQDPPPDIPRPPPRPARPRLADIALALGAIIPVLAAAEAFFAHRGLWILRTETVRNLEAFARRLDYYQAGLDSQPPEPATVDALHAELDAILTADHTTWQHLRATTSATPGTGDTPAISTQP